MTNLGTCKLQMLNFLGVNLRRRVPDFKLEGHLNILVFKNSVSDYCDQHVLFHIV